MAEIKTKKTTSSVEDFILSQSDEGRRDDCFAVMDIMKEITKCEPAMWGSSIVGFGSWHYVYASGQEGDWPVAAFSPRKQNLTLYLTPGVYEKNPALMKKLGKCKTAKSCLYIKRLSDIDVDVLKQLLKKSVQDIKTQSVKQNVAAKKKPAAKKKKK